MSKTLPALTLSVAAIGLCTGAFADTGAAVHSRTLAAMHDGSVVGRFGVPSRNVNPWEYPSASAPAAVHPTRAEVEAQTLAAMHDGTVIGRFGVPSRNVDPWMYPPAAAAGHRT